MNPFLAPFCKRIGLFLLFVASLFLLLSGLLRPQSAMAQEGDLKGVDIVFIVDQSGSMGGAAFGSELHPIPNDPNGLRFLGLQQMVERLASYRMNYYHDSEVRFNIAVIYFGEKAVVQTPPTIIDPDNPAEWEALGERLEQELSAEAFPGNLGYTDHLGALQEAKRMLDLMQQDWRPGQRHRQVIFMLTDGEWSLPCPQPPEEGQEPATPVPEPWYCSNGQFNNNAYIARMNRYIQENLPASRYDFYVGGINDRSRDWWSYVRRWWERWTDGNAELLEANTMWAFFERALSELTVNDKALSEQKTTLGTAVPITESRIEIRPYLQSVTFIVHKPDPEQRIKIYQTDGQWVEELPTTTVAGADTFIEQITVVNPVPGYWTIEQPTTAEIKDIFMVSLEAEVDCQPLGTTPQFIPMRIQCEVTGRNGAIPPYEDPRYQLQVQARIRGNGSEQRLTLSSTQAGIYETFWIPAAPGQYEINVVGSTQKPTGEPFDFFGWPKNGDPAMITVEETRPRLETSASPTAMMPMTINVSLVDANGKSLNIPPGAEKWVQMRLEIASTDEQAAVDLAPSEKGYTGSVTLAHPGAYQVRLLGEVEDPVSGQRIPAFDEGMPDLAVSPPKLAWEGFSSPWPQYKAAPIAFRLTDQEGKSFVDQIDITRWKLNAQAFVQRPDGQEEEVDLNVSDAGGWDGEFAPQQAGDFLILASVWAEDLTGGSQIQLHSREPIFPFAVKPMTKVEMALLLPTDGGTFSWRDLFWRVQPLVIEAAITDAAGGALDPKDVFVKPGDPFEIEVLSPSGESSGALALKQGDAPGKYRAVYDDYQPYRWFVQQNLGWHEVTLHPRTDFQNTYVMERDEDVSVRVNVVRHPLWWVAPLLLGIVFLALAGWTGKNAWLRLWVAQGRLVTNDGRLIGRLADSGKHTVTYTHNLPPDVKKVKVSHPLGKKQVVMTVWKRGRGGKGGGKLGPSRRSSLGGIRYEPNFSGPPRIGFSWGLLFFSLLTLFFIGCFSFALYAVALSLG